MAHDSASTAPARSNAVPYATWPSHRPGSTSVSGSAPALRYPMAALRTWKRTSSGPASRSAGRSTDTSSSRTGAASKDSRDSKDSIESPYPYGGASTAPADTGRHGTTGVPCTATVHQ
jgi:hypothetical protein